MTTAIGPRASSTPNPHAESHEEKAGSAKGNSHEKKISLGSFNPLKPPGLSDLPKPPGSNILKPPKPPRAPGLPNIPARVTDTVSNIQDRVNQVFGGIRNHVKPKPTIDPNPSTHFHQIKK